MIFRLRAECAYDVQQLQHLLGDRASAWKVSRAIEGFPDCAVEFESALSGEAIRRAARCVPDGHVMAETLTSSVNDRGMGVSEELLDG